MFSLSKGRNRRFEPRIPAAVPIRVTVLHEKKILDGVTTDCSNTGVGLLLNEFIMFQLPVEVCWGTGYARGRIQYCRLAPNGGYVAGVKIDRCVVAGAEKGGKNTSFSEALNSASKNPAL